MRDNLLVKVDSVSVFGRLAGYEDVNDAERLRHDPAMRWVVGGRAAMSGAASPSQMGRLETRWLAAGKNLSALSDLSGRWIDRIHSRRPTRGILLDMNSSVSPTHGEQEKSCWNGHYECTCYHPLFLFNQFGDLERCALRPGNVHSADGWDGVLKPVVARYKGRVSRLYFRGDAGFANPDIYDYLEAESVKYAIRLPTNRVLQEKIGHLLTRPVGRPPNEVPRSYANFSYQAGSWTKPRRVVAKSNGIPANSIPASAASSPIWRGGPRTSSPSTTSAEPASSGSRRAKGRINWTRLSCSSFAANAVGLQLHALVDNLGNFLRTLATPEPIKDRSMTTLKEKLIKIGAKVVSHDRYVAFQMAQAAIPINLFPDIPRMIAELRLPPVTSTA